MAEMSDIEVVRLCARARGLRDGDGAGRHVAFDVPPSAILAYNKQGGDCIYHPLTDKAQAMDLVIELGLSVNPIDEIDALEWEVECCDSAGTLDKDLLRAICLCAAKVQQAKESK